MQMELNCATAQERKKNLNELEKPMTNRDICQLKKHVKRLNHLCVSSACVCVSVCVLIDFVSFQNFANSFSLLNSIVRLSICVCLCVYLCKCTSVCVCVCVYVLHFRQTDKAAALAYLLPCAKGLALRIRQRGTLKETE